jgi:hypothetical protein
MAIRFLNIRSNEELVADTEPKISALWFSSDKGPNVNQGQDFGWRLAPEVVVEMEQIMADPAKIQEIANRFRMAYEDVKETDVLTWISDKTVEGNAPIADQSDYTDAYNEKIKRLKVRAVTEAQREADRRAAKTTTTTSTESLADMEKRVELMERLAKAQAATSPTVTHTTTKVK